MNPTGGHGPLGEALVDLTEPPPGIAQRVLGGFPAVRPRKRSAWRQWAVGAVALLLTAATVAALLVIRQPAVPSHARPVVPTPTPAVEPPPPVSAHGISAATFTSPSAGWVLQATGISSTADGGRHWTTQPGTTTGTGVIGVWAGTGGVVLAVTREFGSGRPATPTPVFWRSADGGAHWRRLTPPSDSSTYWGPISVKDANEAWVVTQTPAVSTDPIATILHTIDGGQTWQVQATFHVMAVLGPYLGFFQGNLVFLDGRRGILEMGGVSGPEFRTEPPFVLTTADGGAHWSRVHLPQPPQDIDSTNQFGALAVPADGGRVALLLGGVGARRDNLSGPESTPEYVYATADGGQHWSGPHVLPGTHTQIGRYPLAALDDAHWWWADGTDVYLSRDQGRHWSARGALPRPAELVDIEFSSAENGWAVAASIAGSRPNTVFTTGDGGRTWTAVAPPDPIHVRAGCDATPAPVTFHVHLSELTTNAASYPPAGVGVTSSCRYWLSTRARDGVIDVALPPAQADTTLTLGDFLDVWGFAYQALPGQPLLVYVNGQPYPGDLRSVPLVPHADIVIEPQGANPLPPPAYDWPPGQ
ncbi:MAG TPA: hypothetical protein VE953_14050 [Terriglobales bacterium]|nr:hypothetical protein [Terriglobales bacterium]